MSNRNKGLYIYVNHIRMASKKDKGLWDVFEEVRVKNNYKNSLVDTATTVLDCVAQKVIKNRSSNTATFREVLAYLAKNHKEVADMKDMYDALDAYEERAKVAQSEESNAAEESSDTPKDSD